MATAPVYETQRSCPQCGGSVDLSNVKPGGMTFCPACRKGGRRVSIHRRKTPPPLADLDDATSPGWDDEPAAAADWRDMLGAEVSEPLATCEGSECECSGPRFRYTADHTGTVCPECGPECWQPSMDAYRRGAEHAKATAPRKPGTVLGLSPAAADEQARAFARDRARLLRAVDAMLADQRLTADSRTDLEWFATEIRAAESPARLVQLADEMAASTFERRGWWRGTVELDDWTDDDDDQADDDTPELPEPPARRELPAPGFQPVPGVLYGPGGVVVSVPAGISAAGMAQLREWNRRASGL